MSNPFVGEIRMFGGNFAPAGWAFCQGQLMAISENDVLFNLIGTTYGGDGQTTFALPDLQSRVPMHQGNGFTIGEKAGVETVTLTTNQIPAHSHVPLCNQNAGSTASAANSLWAANATVANPTYATAAPNAAMDPAAVGLTGGSQPHDNMIPFLGINFILSLFGIFPSQT